MGFDRLQAMLGTPQKTQQKIPLKCGSKYKSDRQVFIARNNEKTNENMKRRFINMPDIEINNLWRFFPMCHRCCSRKNQSDPIVRFVYIELISLLFIKSIVYAYKIARRICPYPTHYLHFASIKIHLKLLKPKQSALHSSVKWIMEANSRRRE